MKIPLQIIFETLYYLFDFISLCIVVSAVLSWFISPYNRFYIILKRFVSPFIRPFEKLMNRFIGQRGVMVDISPLLAVLAIRVVCWLLILLQNAII